jgi:hypothetical protein
MKSRLLIALAAICFFAQTGNAQTIVYDKYFVGVDLHWIWGKGSTSPSLFFKIIDSKRKKSGNFSSRKGWRFRLNADYDKQADVDLTMFPFEFRPINTGSFGLYSGYEWHKGYKMFDFFYGFDLFLGAKNGLDLSYWLYDWQPNGQVEYWSSWINQKSIGAGPIAGLSIKIIDGLHISLESAWYANFYRNKYISRYNQDPANFVMGSGFKTRLYPVNTLNVMFSFR